MTDRLTGKAIPLADEDELLNSTEVDIAQLEHTHEQSAHHAHIHSEESLRQVVNRLSRIEGHIRGIKAMVQESCACPDVLIQIAAVRGALDRVARMVLDEHLTECLGRAAREGDIETELEELKLALDRFLPRNKPSGKKQAAG